jgi:hypothetical protein
MASPDDRETGVGMTLPIPTELLPTPRLVIWHGDPETDAEFDALAVLRRAYRAVLAHGFYNSGKIAGGNDWTGYHLPDAEAVAGMATVARAIGPTHWKVIEE